MGCLSTIISLSGFGTSRDEQEKNNLAMRSSDPCDCDKRGCRVGTKNGSAAEGAKGSTLLRTAETKCPFKKTSREIFVTRGGSARSRAHGQRGMGTADCRRADWRDALPAKCRPLFRACFEHEALHHRTGARKTWPGIQVPHHAGNERNNFERRFDRKCGARGARRSESFQPQISL